MIKFIKIICFSFLTLINLAPVLLSAEAQVNLTKIKFATDWRAQAEQGGFYHALALGLYEERGLDVEIIQGNAGINIPRLLAAKEIEFGMGSNSFVPLNMLGAVSYTHLTLPTILLV